MPLRMYVRTYTAYSMYNGESFLDPFFVRLEFKKSFCYFGFGLQNSQQVARG